jgi:hypothetical protein
MTSFVLRRCFIYTRLILFCIRLSVPCHSLLVTPPTACRSLIAEVNMDSPIALSALLCIGGSPLVNERGYRMLRRVDKPYISLVVPPRMASIAASCSAPIARIT